MQYKNILSSFSSLERDLVDRKMEYSRAKDSNKNYEKNKYKIDKLQELYELLNTYMLSLNTISLSVTKNYNKFKQDRLNVLSTYIDSNLIYVFPNETLTSDIRIDNKYKKDFIKLYLKDEVGNFRNPAISEGGFCSELLSFTSIFALCSCLGLNKMYLDEAFANSDPDNLAKVGQLLNHAVSNGFQVLIIEQRNDVCKDIPRREFHLSKDPILKKVMIDSVLDFE